MTLDKLAGISPFYPEIVVGSSLPALIYCYFYQVPFVSTQDEKPDLWEYFPSDIDLSVFNIPEHKVEVATPEGQVYFGMRKCVLWEKLYFLLSIQGLVLGAEIFSSIKVNEDQTKLKCITSNNKKIEFRYNKLTVFSDSLVPGLGEPTINPNILLKVKDYINVKKGMIHKIDFSKKEVDVCAELLFYHSARRPEKIYLKDVIATSYIYENELLKDKYNEVGVRINCVNRMKNLGITGKHGKMYVRAEHDQRVIYPLEPKFLYAETKKLKIIKTRMDEESIIKMFSKMKIDNATTKTNKFLSTKTSTPKVLLEWMNVRNNETSS